MTPPKRPRRKKRFDAGAEIFEFLKLAIAGREPDQDRTDAERITVALLEILDPLEPKWTETQRTIGYQVATHLRPTPAHWAPALALMFTYLDAVKVVEHPRADRSFSFKEGSVRRLKVPLQVSRFVAEALLKEGDSDARIAFLEQADDWGTWMALCSSLPSLSLDRAEIVVFIRCALADRNSPRVGPMEVLPRLREWAICFPDVAQAVVDEWVADTPGFQGLDLGAIRVMAEGAVEQNVGMLGWRNALIAKLTARPRQERWALGAHLACFAWPAEARPPVAARHQALIDQISMLPDRLLSVGFDVLCRDARSDASAAVATASRLLALPDLAPADPNSEIDRATYLAAVLTNATIALVDRKDNIGVVHLVEHLEKLLPIPPEKAGRSFAFSLDSLLRKLTPFELGAVHDFLGRWLERHGHRIRYTAQGLAAWLPLLASALNDREQLGTRWLVAWSVSPRERLRDVALRLLAEEVMASQRGMGHGLPDSLFAQLSHSEAGAAGHAFAGAAQLGEGWVPLVFQLGEERLDTLPEVLEVLEGYAMREWPGAFQSGLGAWDRTLAAMPDEHRAEHVLGPAIARLRAAWDNRLREFEARRELADIFGETIPTARFRFELRERALQESMAEHQASGASFLSFVTQMHIGRGSASRVSPEDGRLSIPKETRTQMEAPVWELYDPVASRLCRFMHQQRAAELLRAQFEEQS